MRFATLMIVVLVSSIACAEVQNDEHPRSYKMILTPAEFESASRCIADDIRRAHSAHVEVDQPSPNATDDEIRAEVHRAAAAVLLKHGKRHTASVEIQIACGFVKAADCDQYADAL